MTAPAYAVRRPYNAPAEGNARLREPESYEPGELTTAGTGTRTAPSGTTGNRPRRRRRMTATRTYAYAAPALTEENARLRGRLEPYDPAELPPISRGGNSR